MSNLFGVSRHFLNSNMESNPIDPERVGIFRALQLGDMLVAIPALRALRSRFPRARLTLIGLPWAQELVARLQWIDDFLPLPGYPGLPETPLDAEALPGFFDAARSRGFDLAIQLHGSGEITNDIVAQLGAKACAGFYSLEKHKPARGLFVPWPQRGPELMRLLELPRALGATVANYEMELPLSREDFHRVAKIWNRRGGEPRTYACVHPGARLSSRRWPAERFAEIADSVYAAGIAVVLTGSTGDALAANRFLSAVRYPVINLTGKTDLGTLAALVSRARLVICNDTGLSHVAVAVGAPSVVISSGSDVERWAPLDHSHHRVLWHRTACRPCAYEDCPTGHECAHGVSAESVLEAVESLLAKDPLRPGERSSSLERYAANN
jgi:ADP-heptose:LPS heptosyltransferase